MVTFEKVCTAAVGRGVAHLDEGLRNYLPKLGLRYLAGYRTHQSHDTAVRALYLKLGLALRNKKNGYISPRDCPEDGTVASVQ